MGRQAFIAHGIDDGRIDIEYYGLGPVPRRCRCRNAWLGDRPLIHDGCVEREGELHETRWGIRREFETALYGVAPAVAQRFARCLVHDAATKLIALSCLEIAIRDYVNEGDISIAHKPL